MECSVCCEKFSQARSITERTKVTCPYCAYEVCSACFRRYILESAVRASCMSCHRELCEDFVAEHTPKSFHNSVYRKSRAEILFSQEKNLLPATQELAARTLQRKKNKVNAEELRKQVKAMREEIYTLTREIDRLLSDNPVRNDGEASTSEEKQRQKFIMSCPRSECRGFVSSAWKCGTCDMYSCSKCHEPTNGRDDKEHECNPDNVASAALIKKETKPCPQCSVPTFRISGCPQMWCVECKATWSWTTGALDNSGMTHNPHYFEWLRKQSGGEIPRQPGDVPHNPCARDLDFYMLQRTLGRSNQFPDWEKCAQTLGHIRGVVMYRYPLVNGVQDNTDLRLAYLMQEIDEEKWKRELEKRLKAREKNYNVNQILDMYVNVLRDLFNTYLVKFESDAEAEKLKIEAKKLRLYTNRELEKVASRYNNKTPYITTSWQVSSQPV